MMPVLLRSIIECPLVVVASWPLDTHIHFLKRVYILCTNRAQSRSLLTLLSIARIRLSCLCRATSTRSKRASKASLSAVIAPSTSRIPAPPRPSELFSRGLLPHCEASALPITILASPARCAHALSLPPGLALRHAPAAPSPPCAPSPPPWTSFHCAATALPDTTPALSRESEPSSDNPPAVMLCSLALPAPPLTFVRLLLNVPSPSASATGSRAQSAPVDAASNAPSMCAGVAGSPARSVWTDTVSLPRGDLHSGDSGAPEHAAAVAGVRHVLEEGAARTLRIRAPRWRHVRSAGRVFAQERTCS